MQDAAQTVLIPLQEIDPHTLRRDRRGLDADALAELKGSILRNGLRAPIEICRLTDPPRPGIVYGLISGFRRLNCFSALHAEGLERFATIPAFIRTPENEFAAYAAMVEENAVRADLTPWEQGATAVHAANAGYFDSTEGAVDGLHPHASRQKRARIKKIARAVDELGEAFPAGADLSERQCLRLAHAVEAGFGDVIRGAMETDLELTPAERWRLALPYLEEAECLPVSEKPITARPTRILRPRRGLVIRRETTATGYAVHINGPRATPELLDELIREVGRLFMVERVAPV